MIVTNNFGLPEPLVEAVKNDTYSKGHANYSATDLVKPVQAVELERRYGEHVTKDASDMLWALYGKIVHDILEKADTGKLKEKRLYYETDEGVILSGQFDRCALIEKNGKLILQDYKLTTVWAHILDKGMKPEWIQQANIYAFLLRNHGFEVHSLEIVAMFRDWQRSKAEFDANYPPGQIHVYDLPLWDYETQKAWIEAQLMRRVDARTRTDQMLALEKPCSDEERWFKPGKWAIYRNANKTASRLCDSEKHAKEYIDWAIANKKIKPTDKITIEERPGVNNRCKFYCDAAPWCHQRKALGVEIEGDKL